MWEDFKYFLSDLDAPIAIGLGIIGLLVLFLGALIFDAFVNQPIILNGQVLGKEYSPSHVGIGITNVNGKTGTTTEYYPEKWTLVLKYKNNINSVQVSPEVYYSYNIGDNVNIQCRKGTILRMVLCSNSTIAK